MLGLANPALAQTFTVQSISTPDLGNVASGATGDTTFQLASPNGNVTKMSGNGARVSSGTARALVTVRCGTETLCGSKNAKITIARSGTLVKRARALSNFTVSASGATASIVTTPTTGNTITFEIGPIGTNATKTFWVGFDYPIAGDDSGLLSGAASSGFTVTISRTNSQAPISLASAALATAFRPLNMTLTSNLAFGTVSRPRTGSGSVTVDAATGSRSVTGAGVQALNSPSPSRAGYTVSGEGGQTFSIAVPDQLRDDRSGRHDHGHHVAEPERYPDADRCARRGRRRGVQRRRHLPGDRHHRARQLHRDVPGHRAEQLSQYFRWRNKDLPSISREGGKAI